jgi:hypothetical protein
MNPASACRFSLVLFLLLLLTACAGNHPGQAYPDAPASFKADDTGIYVSNYAQTRSKPLVFGLGMSNEGSTPITLDSLKLVDAPSNITLIATGAAYPTENDKTLLPVGGIEYPPILEEQHRPYTLHPLSQAILQPQEYAEALVALQSSKVGTFLVKGFLLTLEMNGQTYQHYYPLTAVLCVEVDHATCDAAVKQADDNYHNQQGH